MRPPQLEPVLHGVLTLAVELDRGEVPQAVAIVGEAGHQRDRTQQDVIGRGGGVLPDQLDANVHDGNRVVGEGGEREVVVSAGKERGVKRGNLDVFDTRFASTQSPKS